MSKAQTFLGHSHSLVTERTASTFGFFLETEKKKDAVVKQTRQSRESMLVSFSETWEKEVLPNVSAPALSIPSFRPRARWVEVPHILRARAPSLQWKAVYRPENVHLRNMWWEGSMPPRHRGRIWGMCIGNGLAVGKG